MTRSHSLTLASIAALIALGCGQPPADAESATARDTASDRQAIEQVREREIGSFRAGAPDSGAATFAADAVLMAPDEPAVTGRDSIRAWLKRGTDQYRVDGRYTKADIVVAGDWAIERYDGELTLTPKAGGRPIQERFKGIHAYRREPDGSWRIAQDVWNRNAPPPAAAPR
jgi:ketosteroid isomerase-like protein